MPEEEQISEHLNKQVEQEELLKQFEERQENTRKQMGILFDEAEKQGKRPKDMIIDESEFDRAIEIYGQERIEKFKLAIYELEYTSKEEFVRKMMEIITPYNYDRFFDPEIRKRAEEIEKRYKQESFKTGKLDVTIHPSDWNFTFNDGTKITQNDLVIEIHWPEEGEKPKGVKDVKESFQNMVDILNNNPHIKAVIGVSWMMSRDITDQLGFEKFSVDIKADQIKHILDMASTARRDKNYPKDKDIAEKDIMLGAISREQFLEKYGK